TSLDSIQHPVLVANGDTDVMVTSINSVELARKLPHSELSIFPDAGHGAIFQYHSAFLDQTLRFLHNYPGRSTVGSSANGCGPPNCRAGARSRASQHGRGAR